MSAPRPAPRRLRRRLMLAFSGFALLVTALFGLYVVVFVYLVEDRFFQELLQQESGRQLQQYARDGHWAPAQLPFVSVHADAAGLPDGLGARLAAEPWRREFDGPQGRHYHLQLLQPAPPAAPAWLVAEVSQHLVVRPMRGGILQWLAWSAAAVLVLALLLAAWLARRMSAPLSRLAQQIEQADPARLPAAIARGFGDDEVGTLARGLEALIVRIEAFVAREREFTGDASHELRTPLAVIRSACERIIARGALDPAVQGQFEHIRQSALQLEQTVATLLALAREQNAGEAVVEVALLPLLERVIVDQAEVLDGRALELRLQVPAQARARVPPTVLHIVLSNLLGNAFAHGHDGVIVIDLDDGWLRISNPGERLSETAFEAFAKGQASAGFGLGLAIVRRLCERHRIALEYRYEDAASVVRIGLAAAC